jgi:ABC-type Fe3+/spermidine/putrescine transport system ATPase subunit
MIEIQGLKIAAGNFRIEHLDLILPEGGYHVLLGPTGSGKTLILESVIGLRNLEGGKIRVGGKEIQNLPSEQRGISYVPQDLALFPHLTVRDNLLYGLRAQRRFAEKNEDHLDRLIDALKIGHLLDRYPQGLSGGEKQRVALGRALAPSPQLLLVDEPLVALDPGLRNEIQQLLISLHRSLKFTALHVTHDLEEAYLLGDTITVLIGGEVEQRGKREEVFLRPNTLKVAEFLGLRNLFPERVLKISGDGKLLTVSFWGREIVLPSDHAPRLLSAGEQVVLYLRPEEVMILREGKSIKESLRQSTLAGEIARILDRGTYRWVSFRPAGIEAFLEIHLPNYVFRNLSIQEGQEIRVAMRRESFWVIPASSAMNANSGNRSGQ